MPSLFNRLLEPFYWLNRNLTRRILRQAMAERRPVGENGGKLLYLAASCLPYHISGYTARTHALLKALMDSGVSVVALTRPGYPWDRKDRLTDAATNQTIHDGVCYNHITKPTRLKQVAHYALAASTEIENFALAHSVGCIHAASNHVNALPGLLAAKRLGLPFQYEMRGLWELSRASRFPGFYNSPPYRMALDLEGFVATNSDRLFVISRQLAEYALIHWQIPEEKINILPNCHSPIKEQPASTTACKPDLLGYAGSLVEYEGLDVLLEALAHLRNKGKIAFLRIIGDGEARERLEDLAANLGLDKQVEFMGRMEPEKAAAALLECEAICLPRKPYDVCKIIPPLKLVEAMSMGKALFAPNLPVFCEELGELGEGWMFESGNAASLASLLEKRLPDKIALREHGTRLREKATATRQWSHFTQSIPYPGH